MGVAMNFIAIVIVVIMTLLSDVNAARGEISLEGQWISEESVCHQLRQGELACQFIFM